ncbi:zinc transporter ZupT [Brachybacterium sp. EF45031]|uniref:zinc transporter ZupT n=1 Tax=Brachybacterium sillae TaxID=2810536 RepID=UPI00217E16FC|nr:zinc transporter ZupT [Brachybacterium sillae]MCS6711125.1 zinc transporter ZupT [Brachybacterium sillae]
MTWAFLLTFLAGAAACVGAGLGLLGREDDDRALAGGLALSAGVMLYVSFVELLPQAAAMLDGGTASASTSVRTALAFFFGIAVIMVLDRLVPQAVNPHERPDSGMATGDAAGASSRESARRSRLLRTGLVTAAVLALHNVPEGFATFMTALQAPEVAIPVAAAIALHNIPEGIAVAVPVHRATGSRRRAFILATFSGLAEPVGALLGYALLAPFLTDAVLGSLLAAVAGVMVFVSLDELLPAAVQTGRHHVAVYSLVAGMAVMAVSLLVLS